MNEAPSMTPSSLVDRPVRRRLLASLAAASLAPWARLSLAGTGQGEAPREKLRHSVR